MKSISEIVRQNEAVNAVVEFATRAVNAPFAPAVYMQRVAGLVVTARRTDSGIEISIDLATAGVCTHGQPLPNEYAWTRCGEIATALRSAGYMPRQQEYRLQAEYNRLERKAYPCHTCETMP
ncbi:MAG: hypothetical protein ACREOI_35765 [bacterium]